MHDSSNFRRDTLPMWVCLIAIFIMIAGLIAVAAYSEARERDMFNTCIKAGRVWVEGNCFPAEEVQG